MRRLVYSLIAIIILAFALGFPAYMAFGQGGGSNVATVTITCKPYSGGGGGGGDVPIETGCPGWQASCVGKITTTGKVLQTIVITSSLDERFQLTIDVDAIALQGDVTPISCIGILETETLPAPPAGAYIISVWYDVFPKGATFSPGATLKYIAGPGVLPTEDRLVIAYYDEELEQWVELESAVDFETGTITAQITKFYDFAIFGYGVPVPPAFAVSSLSVSPRAVYPNETVNIIFLATNTGGQAGSYEVALKINGVTEATQEITLGVGNSQWLTFTTTRATTGVYSVDINGVTGTFEVRERPAPSKPFNWWLIILIIVALLLAAETIYVILKRKQYGGVTGVLAMQGKWIAATAKKLASKVASPFRSLFSKTKT